MFPFYTATPVDECGGCGDDYPRVELVDVVGYGLRCHECAAEMRADAS